MKTTEGKTAMRAKLLGVTVEELLRHDAAGEFRCRLCQGWFVRAKFYSAGPGRNPITCRACGPTGGPAYHRGYRRGVGTSRRWVRRSIEPRGWELPVRGFGRATVYRDGTWSVASSGLPAFGLFRAADVFEAQELAEEALRSLGWFALPSAQVPISETEPGKA